MRRTGIWSFVPLLLLVAIIATMGGVSAKDDDTITLTAPSTLDDARARVVNGKQVDDPTYATRYPGLVALLDTRYGTSQYDQFFCAGTLVTPTLVLTAAHCADATTQASLRVFTGSPSLDQTNRSVTQLLTVKTIVKHPAWNKYDISAGNDLALVTLATAAKKTATTAPISVVGPGEDALWGAGNGVVAAADRGPWLVGWGNTDGAGGEAYPHVAMDSNLQVLPGAACTQYLGSKFLDAVNMCAGGERTEDPVGSGGCNGDSGGPLLTLANGAWRVVAVVSYGSKPCVPTKPGAFVKLATFRPWLQGQGVPVGTTTVAGPLPAPGVTGGGKVLPPGPALTLDSPAEAVALSGFDATLDARWTLRSDQDAATLTIRRDGATIEQVPVKGYIGYRIPVTKYEHGAYQWCVTSVDDVSSAPAGEVCRSFTRVAEHKAELRSAYMKGRRATFKGSVLSTESTVVVSIQVKAGRKLFAKSKVRVKTKAGAITPFSFAAKVSPKLRPKRLTATIVVEAGGAKRRFTSVLR